MRRPLFSSWSSSGLVIVITDHNNWNAICEFLTHIPVKTETINDHTDPRWRNTENLLAEDDSDLLSKLTSNELVLGSIRGKVFKKISKVYEILHL